VKPPAVRHQPDEKIARWKFGFLPQLDGFRGISVFLVLIGHAFADGVGPLSKLGVMMFFVLSGFLITGLLCNEQISTGGISLRNFYLRRALRIFPAFFVLILGTAILIKSGYITDVPWYSLVVACLYLSNIFGRGDSITHLWSLSLEEQFYAGWPLVVRSFGLRRAFMIACSSILAVMAVRLVVIQLGIVNYFNGKIYLRPWFRFDSILIGCCIALFLYDRQPSRQSVARWCRWAAPLVVMPALLLWSQFSERVPALRPVHLTVQLLLAATLLLYIVVFPNSMTARAMTLRPLRFLGRISYSLYLWQQMFLMTHDPSWGLIREFPWNILAALGAGIASHYVVERPFLKLKHRLSAANSVPSKSLRIAIAAPETVDAT